MFRPIIRTDKCMPNANTQFSSLSVRFFHAFFVTDRCFMVGLPSVGESHVCSSFSVQLRHKTFVIKRISSSVESHVLD